MKKLMILGAGVYQLPLVKYASNVCSVVLVAPEITDEFKELVTQVYYSDLRNKEYILDIAKNEKIDGIITDQTDIPVRTVAYVAEKLGLSGISYETACLFTDKNKMRAKLKELNLPYIPYKDVFNYESAVKAAREIGYPIIIKPVDNQGSRGVYKIEKEEDLFEKFNLSIDCSMNGQVLIEKYIDGKEAVVEGIVFNNKYDTLICGDTTYFDIENAFAAKRRSFPSKLPKSCQNKILELNKKIIEGFGLRQGITHSEFIIDGEDVFLIETAARGGGVFISSDLIYLSTGLCTERFLVDIALGENPNIVKNDNRITCCYVAFFLPFGKVIYVEGVNEVKNFEFVHNSIIDKIEVGMQTKKAEDKTSRYCIIVSGNNFEELECNINRIKNTLDIRVQTENGIESIIWG